MALTGLLLPIAMAVAILYVPGALVLRAARLDAVTAAAAAPAIGILLSILAGALMHWTTLGSQLPAGPVALGAVTAVAAAAARLLTKGMKRTSPVPMPHWSLAASMCALTFILTAVGLALTLGAADAWPQMPDNILHVGAVTWMARHGSAWMPDVTQYVGGQASLTYPAAWHVIASLITQWTGADALVASHALALVVAGLVWPAAMSLLVWRTTGTTRLLTVAAPPLAVAFVGMPFLPLAWGVLWPFLLGMALVPLAVVGALWLLQADVSRRSRLQAAVFTTTVLLAAAAAHTSALYLFAAIGVVMLATQLPPNVRRPVRWGLVGAALVVIAVMWSFPPDGTLQPFAGTAPRTAAESFTFLMAAPAANVVLCLLALPLVVIGGIRARDMPELRWLPPCLIGVAAISSFGRMLPVHIQAAALWPWFGDGERLRGVLALLGCLALAQVFRLAAGRRPSRSVPVVAAVALIVLSPIASLGFVRAIYVPTGQTPVWASRDDIAALRRLAGRVPEGAVVAVNPLTGGTQLYRFREVTLPIATEKVVMAPGTRQDLAASLDAIGSDPRACRVAMDLGVQFVVSGGNPVKWDVPRDAFRGIEGVSAAGGFEEIASEGPYRLWRVPACTPSSRS